MESPILYLQPVPIKFYCSFMATHTTSQGLILRRLTKTASETPSLKSSCCQWVYRTYKSAGEFSWTFFFKSLVDEKGPQILPWFSQ